MRYRFDPLTPAARRTTAPADAAIRASDAERSDVADRLSHHFADGRLDEAEFRRRLDTAMAATTRGDLHGLFDDLPPLAREQSPAPTRRQRLLPSAWLVVALVLAVALAAAASAPFHGPWALVVVVALALWFRAGRSRRHHRHHDLQAVSERMDGAA